VTSSIGLDTLSAIVIDPFFAQPGTDLRRGEARWSGLLGDNGCPFITEPVCQPQSQDFVVKPRVGPGIYVAATIPESRWKKHFLRQQSNHSSEKLASLIARSGYPNQQEWFEDLHGNGPYFTLPADRAVR
jgi:hypothetical protein